MSAVLLIAAKVIGAMVVGVVIAVAIGLGVKLIDQGDGFRQWPDDKP